MDSSRATRNLEFKCKLLNFENAVLRLGNLKCRIATSNPEVFSDTPDDLLTSEELHLRHEIQEADRSISDMLHLLKQHSV